MIKLLLIFGCTISLFSESFNVTEESFKISNNTILGEVSGIEWENQYILKRSYNMKRQAELYCNDLVLNEKDDWRLPTLEELKYALILKNKFKTLYTTYKSYSRTHDDYSFWSSTYSSNQQASIDFRKNEISYNDYYAYNGHNVRCIRGVKYNTVEDLNKYITKIKLYTEAKKLNTVKAYVAYLNKFPNTSEAKEIKKLLFPMQKQEFDKVNQQNNISGYEWFIKTYPKASQVKEAIAKIHQLAFDEAEDIDTISAYNTFIISYPMAQEVKEANALAKELERYKYTDTLPSWVRSIMPDFLADILNKIFGIFSSDEKKSRALLIKAKQIERQGNEYYGAKKAGYVMITNRMYDLLQEEYDDTDATLRFLESEEFKDFVRTFKSVMSSMNDRLNDISRYSSEILEVSKQGFSEANADRDMSEYKNEEQRKWQKFMHFRDKGYN